MAADTFEAAGMDMFQDIAAVGGLFAGDPPNADPCMTVAGACGEVTVGTDPP
jgi:hypothetical protein